MIKHIYVNIRGYLWHLQCCLSTYLHYRKAKKKGWLSPKPKVMSPIAWYKRGIELDARIKYLQQKLNQQQ